jgi:hypothetical protein
MNIPFDIPITLPVNTNAMLGQMDMQQLHVLGLLLVVGLAVACAVIGRKALHASSRRATGAHVAVDRSDRRDLDQAA